MESTNGDVQAEIKDFKCGYFDQCQNWGAGGRVSSKEAVPAREILFQISPNGRR